MPGMGDLRAGYRFLAPALRAAGYRVACTDLRGHGDSDATFMSYGDEETAGDITALIEELGGPAVVVGNSMGASAAVLAAAQRPELISGLVLAGPFVRNGKTSTPQRLILRAAMAPQWAAISWKSYLAKLYACRRPADFEEYRPQVIASIRRPGYAKAFSRTSHDPAQARLADVTAPVRPHRALGQLAPAQAATRPPEPINLAEHQIRRKQVLGGLIHEYQIAA